MRHAGTLLAASLLLVAGAWAQAPSVPAGPGAEVQWLPRYDFALEVDGRPSPDCVFYQEANGRRILVNAPEVPQICVLNQEGKQVSMVDRARLKSDGETVRLAAGLMASAPTSGYSIDGSSVVFFVGGRRLKIVPKQPLVGPATVEDLLRHSPLYRKGADAYAPATADLAFLKSVKEPVEIEVFFGTWCSHCKVLVPKFIQTIRAAANPNLRVSYHGVPTSFGNYEPARTRGITGIPTFIFMRKGAEVGRIPGEPTNGTIERSMVDILRTAR